MIVAYEYFIFPKYHPVHKTRGLSQILTYGAVKYIGKIVRVTCHEGTEGE
jgi:hypothetical protein